ncbi:MAG: hypothetical protein ABR936_15960 [Bacteroidota bacterium]
MHKQNRYQQQKEIKEHHKILFYRQLEQICTLVGGPDTYRLLPNVERYTIYLMRSIPYKIKAAEDTDVPPKILAALRDHLPRVMQQETMPLYEGGPTVSLQTAYRVGWPLALFLYNLEETAFPEAAPVKQVLRCLWENKTFMHALLDRLDNFFDALGSAFSSYHSCSYWFTKSMPNVKPGTFGIQYDLLVHKYIPEQRHIVLDDKRRPVIQVYWAESEEGPVNAHLDAVHFGMEHEKGKTKYPVLIQFHALQRLDERLDCFFPAAIHMNVYLSLLIPHITRTGENTFLIEYSIFGTKVGYFRALVQDHTVILQTFLLITQNGTPEGNKLQEICGLSKLDKTFLSIDRLSFFMTTEFDTNPSVRTLFEQAGCASLLDAYKALSTLVKKKAEPSALQTFAHYLGLDARPEYLDEVILKEWVPTPETDERTYTERNVP